MKIVINSKDRTDELKALIDTGIQGHDDEPHPVEVPSEINALALREAQTESEYQEIFTRLMRYRDNVDTMPFDIPHRGGLRGRCSVWLKRKLWTLLRYQHDRITFRQNLVNSLYSSALEYERDQRRSDIERLESRIAELEKGKRE